MAKDNINGYTRIFFISIFLAFSVFALYLSFCDAYNYKGDSGKMFFLILLFSFITCILWTKHTIWYNLGKLVFSLVFVIIIIKNYKRIETECGILYQYIKRQYYLYEDLGSVAVNKIRTSTSVLGLPVYEKLAMVLAVFLVIIIMAIAVLRLKCYFLLMLPVVSVIGMEMFHGKAPSVTAYFFLITGMPGLLFSMKLEIHGGRRNFWQERHMPGQIPERYSLFIAVLVVCFIISFITGKATSQKMFTYSGRMLEKQHKMEKEVITFVKTLKEHGNNGADGYLGNNKPDHTGKAVMRIETIKKPANDIYIKHFTSDIYENGVWKSFGKDEPPVTEMKINQEAVGSIEAFIRTGKDMMSAWAWPGNVDRINMEIIKDWKFTGDNTFTPYMYDTSKDSQQFKFYNLSDGLVKYLMAMDIQEMKRYGMKNNEEYTAFVYDNYLQVPYGLSRLKAFADEIITVNDLGLECSAVKNAICRDTMYSQHLNVLPAGEEYIEYFLFKQKRGYCEHYATAGTILLRMKGVPARYVSGYFIKPSEFNIEYDKAGNEKYVAYVKDYNAHAWTEIYKEGFGWLPFDMTNTVLGDDYNSNTDLQPGTEENQQEGQEMPLDTAAPEDILPDDISDEDDFGQEDLQEDLKEETEDINSEGNTAKKEKVDSSGNTLKIPKKPLIVILVLLALSAPVIYIRAGFVKTNRRIHLADTANQRVVLYFNLLNNYLSFCGFKKISNLEDAAYASKISEIAAGIPSEGVFAILQYAVFSNNIVNPDDEGTAMEFVQEISGSAYKRCNRLRRLMVYILTGRKKINIFTKISN